MPHGQYVIAVQSTRTPHPGFSFVLCISYQYFSLQQNNNDMMHSQTRIHGTVDYTHIPGTGLLLYILSEETNFIW